MRRFWRWLKALFVRAPVAVEETQYENSVYVPGTRHVNIEFPVVPRQSSAAQSANICIVSKGSTQRERRYARDYLRQAED